MDKPEIVKTSQIVRHQHLNHHGTLFGGEALQMMDTTAAIAARRRVKHEVVTVAVEQVVFEAPVNRGDIADFEAHVVHVGRTSVRVELEMFAEVPETGERHRAGHGTFVMVAVDDQGRSVAIDAES